MRTRPVVVSVILYRNFVLRFIVDSCITRPNSFLISPRTPFDVTYVNSTFFEKYASILMLASMDICNINNKPSGHFDTENGEKTPSVIDQANVESGKFESRLENERVGKKRKTRRFKSRYKGKSDKKSKNVMKKMRNRVYPQSEAPYNTNQFLMADHNNIENLDDKLSVARVERSRNRESSFTSVDSDEDQFYSSPEDEDEFLTKDFVDTYQTLCAEKFGNLSKAQLTKIIFELEAKVEELSKNTNANSKVDDCILLQANGLENKELRIEIKDILKENERLRNENAQLKEFIRENASMVSSTSSSSSSSGDSDSESSNSDDHVEDRT